MNVKAKLIFRQTIKEVHHLSHPPVVPLRGPPRGPGVRAGGQLPLPPLVPREPPGGGVPGPVDATRGGLLSGRGLGQV